MKELKKGNNRYYLCGSVMIGNNTFQTDNNKEGSDYVYSSMNLMIDCGDCGKLSASMMGGYHKDGSTLIRCHGAKKSEYGGNTIDYANSIQVKWNERFNKNVISNIAKQEFISVSIEKDEDGKTKNAMFLSEYDAIAYLQAYLENGMKIVVSGEFVMRPNPSDADKPYMNRTIKSIRLAKPEEKVTAHAKLSVIVPDDAVVESKPNANGLVEVKSYFVDYVYRMNGQDIKGNLCFPFMFNIETNKNENYGKFISMWFTPTKGKANKMTCEFEWRTSIDSVGKENIAEYSDDIKMLVESGLMTKEEADAEVAKGLPDTVEMTYFVRPALDGNRKLMFAKDEFDNDDLRFVTDFMIDNTADVAAVETAIDDLSNDDKEVLANLGIDLSNLDSDENVDAFFNLNDDELPF